MLLKPRLRDFRIIGFYLSKMIFGIAVFMLVPMVVSFFCREWNPFCDFLISFLFSIFIGFLLNVICFTKEDPQWSHGMFIVSLAWLLAAFLGAVPLFLSGHWLSFLDAFFDSMSGFTTTGLTLSQDLAHLSYGHQLWRHLIMFLGGQGIVVVVLSLLAHGGAGSFRLYVGEARDERITPDIRRTAQFIWAVSLIFLCLGTGVLGLIAYIEGMPLLKSFFHGACIFMGAFDTGGFAPHQQNIMYYHSFAFELGTMIFMLLGAINFKLHYAVWSGNRKEIWKNIETITLFWVLMITFLFVAVGLSQHNTYDNLWGLFRKGFYQHVSAQTGTGFQTIYSDQFPLEWSGLALSGLILAMSFGGSICSTTGAIKMLRIGMVAKTFMADIKRYISPEKAIFLEKVHHIKKIILNEAQMRSACLITIAYIFLYIVGALVGMLCGYPFVESLFESTSTAANVGISCGITSPTMPTILKITYIIQMWAGRLEFMSLFVLIGFVVALIKGK